MNGRWHLPFSVNVIIKSPSLYHVNNFQLLLIIYTICKVVIEVTSEWEKFKLRDMSQYVLCVFCLFVTHVKLVYQRQVGINQSNGLRRAILVQGVARVSYGNFVADKFRRLRVPVGSSTLVISYNECATSCVNAPACASFNLASFPDADGKFLCELLDEDKYSNLNQLVSSKHFHHFSIKVLELINFFYCFVSQGLQIKINFLDPGFRYKDYLMNVVYPLKTLSRSNSVERENECTFRTYSFKNFLHEHSTFPLAFYYKKATRIAHILPERVGNSDFSQDQLLVDMVKNLILPKTIFSRNLIHFEIRFWQSLRYYN